MSIYLKIKNWRYFYDFTLFAAAVGLYSPSLWNGFVGDDYLYFIDNRFIGNFEVGYILLHGAIGYDYCPLRDLSLAFDHLLWGKNPFGFHLTNLIIFGSTTVALKHLITRVCDLLADRGEERLEPAIPQLQAFLAALLFAIHPVQLEVVYAVYNRGALLTNLFFIFSCLAFIRFLRNDQRRLRSYSTALFWCVCTFMSREYGIILPLVLLLLVAFHEPSRRISTCFRTAPFFILAAIFYLVFRQYAVNADYIASSAAPLLSQMLVKAATAFKIMLYYPLRIFFYEIDVSRNQDFSNPLTVTAALCVAGALFAAFAVRRRHPRLLFFLLFYLVCLIPVLNFFDTYPIVADRYNYLPGLGLFCLFTAIPFHGWKRCLPVALIAVTLVIVLATQRLLAHWKDNVSYWGKMATIYPSSYAFGRLAGVLYKEDRQLEAKEALHMAQLVSTGANDEVDIGDRYFEQKQYEDAIRIYSSALSKMGEKKTVPAPDQNMVFNPRIYMDKLYSNLATSYFNTGDFQNALHFFQEAIKLEPRVAILRNNFGALYATMGNYPAALREFELAATLDPDYGDALINLAKFYRLSGNLVKEKECTEVLRTRFPHLLK